MKERLLGLVLLALLLLVVVPGLFFQVFLILCGPERWARDSLRALDNFGNASIFRGNPYETISSHVGNLILRGNAPWWAKALDRFLGKLEAGHCVGAALDEKPILDAIRSAK